MRINGYNPVPPSDQALLTRNPICENCGRQYTKHHRKAAPERGPRVYGGPPHPVFITEVLCPTAVFVERAALSPDTQEVPRGNE
ncbi:MAG: hypothetical protein JWN27_2927 [Candidatus Eremiobacteraeota bacterium]|nr:hypothetical protein [Candidatus Eremiobacteraeota bacterium]